MLWKCARSAVDAERRVRVDDAQRRVDRHLALERAAEGDSEREVCGEASLPGTGGDPMPDRDPARDVGALVTAGEGVGAVDDSIDLGHTGGDGALETACVEDQGAVGHSGGRRQPSDHSFGIGHLRHLGGMDETRHLDVVRPERHRPLDQLLLVRGRQQDRLVLQAISGGHLDNAHVLATHDGRPCPPVNPVIRATAASVLMTSI